VPRRRTGWSARSANYGFFHPKPATGGRSVAPESPQNGSIDETRIDQWLWAVRLFKTRSLAAAACRGGHVKVNGSPAKPARPVRVGDRVEVRVADRDRVLEVVRLIDRRVAAPIAGECLVDHSPPAPPREYVAPLFRRDPGTGRPTKKDRRTMERFRNR
jgi:ribosome-associated heat shock protein Hsp15